MSYGIREIIDSSGGLLWYFSREIHRFGDQFRVSSIPASELSSSNNRPYVRVIVGGRAIWVTDQYVERTVPVDALVMGFVVSGRMVFKGAVGAIDGLLNHLNFWLVGGATVEDLTRAKDFKQLEPSEADPIVDPALIVKMRWDELAHRHPLLAPFLRSASRHDHASRLYGVTSHESFALSRCTIYPFAICSPWVVPNLICSRTSKALQHDGRFFVHSTGAATNDSSSRPIELENALREFFVSIPVEAESAIYGTAMDLLV